MGRSINPPPGSIKSIQRGLITLNGAGSSTATVTAVNPAKSVLMPLGQRLTVDDNIYMHTLTLTNSTTVTATRETNAALNSFAAWQLVEYY